MNNNEKFMILFQTMFESSFNDFETQLMFYEPRIRFLKEKERKRMKFHESQKFDQKVNFDQKVKGLTKKSKG